MEEKNLENTVKKMAIILEKVANKVDELDKRVRKLEMKVLTESAKEENKVVQQTPQTTQSQQSSSFGGFGTGFLSSLLGSFAGMSLFSLLFNHNVSAEEVAKENGFSDEQLAEIDEKLANIDEKLEEIEEKINNEQDFTETGFSVEDIYRDDIIEETSFDGFDGDFDTDFV